MRIPKGYRLHWGSSDAEPEYFETMAELNAEIARQAKLTGCTLYQAQKIAYIMSEYAWQQAKSEEEYQNQ